MTDEIVMELIDAVRAAKDRLVHNSGDREAYMKCYKVLEKINAIDLEKEYDHSMRKWDE